MLLIISVTAHFHSLAMNCHPVDATQGCATGAFEAFCLALRNAALGMRMASHCAIVLRSGCKFFILLERPHPSLLRTSRILMIVLDADTLDGGLGGVLIAEERCRAGIPMPRQERRRRALSTC